MTEVSSNLFVGTCEDYEQIKQENGWVFVAACKEPYHRNALGYTGRGVPKDHPEYLFCYRDNLLILNLVDVQNPAWISDKIIDESLLFVEHAIMAHRKVLVFCNQGKSRSATIAMLYLQGQGIFNGMSFEEAEAAFCKLYPNYEPANGMREYAKSHW